ncbi:MAG: hypothetical protein AAB553_06550 [Patescibacteria group bacterium]
MFIFLLIFLFMSIFLEGTVTTMPLVLITLILASIYFRDWRVFPLAFFSGMVLDIFTFRIGGSSSIFFLCCVFLILLYQRKYEIQTVYFVAVASFIAAFLYLLLFGYDDSLLQALASAITGVVIFTLLQYVLRKKH